MIPLLGAGRAGPPVAPGPAYLLHDTFTDANGTALTAHTMDVGPGWVDYSSTITINSNKAESTVFYSAAAADAGAANVAVQYLADPAGTGPNQVTDIIIRSVDASNYWLFVFYPNDGNIYLYEKIAGLLTLRGAAAAGMDANPHTVKATAVGTTITAFLDGVEKLSYALAINFQTATRHGLRLSTGDTGDNFEVTAA